VAAGAGLFIANELTGALHLHFLYIAPVLFVLCTLVLIVASLTSPAPEAQAVAPYVWTRRFFDAETRELASLPFYQNYRWQSLGLLILAALVVGWFW